VASVTGYAALVATATATATLGDVVGALERLYPTRWAGDGDAVGLVVGDLNDRVARILLAVDPVQVVVDEAVDLGVDLVVVHHPLLLRPVSSVRADRPKGRVVHDLIRHGIALYVAHTNADSPARGVSESMATALGLLDIAPLLPDADDPLDKIVTFAPRDIADRLVDALAAAGAGTIGGYDRCAFVSDGSGTFRPGAHADPHIGTPGVVEVVAETRIEMVYSRPLRNQVVSALRQAHPYEEPAFDVLELAAWGTNRGAGRIGGLEAPVSLQAFADHVAAVLPRTAVGARVSGDVDAQVSRVAVAGGAGDFLLDAVRDSGADVYVTSDLRHHPASEFREHPGAPALVDVPHWAAEWTWLPVAATALTEALSDNQVSHICTDPWNYRATGRSVR
jgi:dinuclear metal center YbgI/SA1388 family protein